MTPFKALLIFLFLSVSVAFGADVMSNDDGLVFYDEIEGPDGKSVPFYSQNEDDEIPGPPGSRLLQTRKRAQSFHISAEEFDSESSDEDNALYLKYSASGRKDRVDSGTTIVDEWEGFDFESGTETPEYNRSKSNSAEAQASGPLTNLRQVFATLSKSRSRSFTKGNKLRLNLVALSEEEGEERG